MTLSTRIASAEVGSRELDAEIWDLVDDRPLVDLGDGLIHKECRTERGAYDTPPAYTTSVDAALSLFKKVLPGWYFNMGNDEAYRDNHWVHLWDDRPNYNGWPHEGQAPTPALALCAAILKAVESEK